MQTELNKIVQNSEESQALKSLKMSCWIKIVKSPHRSKFYN